jgi:hypothetical protein
LAQATEPARRLHALFKCCKAAICAAAAHPTAVYRAPRIVLSIAWTVEHSHCHENTEQKQNKSQHHQSLPLWDYLTGSKNKIWARGCFDLSQNTSLLGPRRFPPPWSAPQGAGCGLSATLGKILIFSSCYALTVFGRGPTMFP